MMGSQFHGDDDLAENSHDEALEALRARGKRITSQRSLLLEIIRQSDCHLDADEIYRLARERDPRISLSTVYRNLNLLKDLGLVSQLHLDEEHHHYELRDDADHYHLICSSCGRVIEFDSALVQRLVTQVRDEKDFVVERAHVDLTGTCAECRAKGD
jgi:Fur family ferric uptake transcriptional regulator